MSARWVARILCFGAGFAVWAFFARGGREAWDVAGYWTIGAPALLVVQASRAGLADGAPWREPLWTLGGHAFAAITFTRGGAGLAPLALVFVCMPLYLALAAADATGRAVRSSAS